MPPLMHHMAVGESGRRGAIEEVVEVVSIIEIPALQIQQAVVHVITSVMLVEVNRRGRRGKGQRIEVQLPWRYIRHHLILACGNRRDRGGTLRPSSTLAGSQGHTVDAVDAMGGTTRTKRPVFGAFDFGLVAGIAGCSQLLCARRSGICSAGRWGGG